jgi:hypothetical protein
MTSLPAFPSTKPAPVLGGQKMRHIASREARFRGLLTAIAFALAFSMPVFAGAETMTVKRFGQWVVMVEPAQGKSSKLAWVRIGQSQNEDEDGIGDELSAEYTGWENKIDLTFRLFHCSKAEYQFERSETVDGRALLSIGVKAATAQLRARLNGWIKEAAAQCTDIKPARIFKMAQFDAGMKTFFSKAAQFLAISEGAK